jgi:hypothetical protein
MARSSYIYVVYMLGRTGGTATVATFTVKHEMVTWIRREWAKAEGPVRVLRVMRHSDGLRREDPLYMGSAQEVAGLV